MAVLAVVGFAVLSNGAFAQPKTDMPAIGTVAISDAGAVGTPASLGATGAPQQVVAGRTAIMPPSGTVAISDGAAVGTSGSLGVAGVGTITAEK